MKRELTCAACRQPFGKPDLLDGTYYFVCGSCGNLKEVPQQTCDADVQTLIRRFEKEYRVTLPDSYKQFLADEPRLRQSYEVTLNVPVPSDLAYYIEDGTVSIHGFYSPDPLHPRSLFSNGYLCEEWQLPKGLVLISGDGHTWIAFNFRNMKTNPPVILRYFTKTKSGRCRASTIVPAPLFVASDMTLPVQAADLAIYCVNRAFRLPKQGMDEPARPEITEEFGPWVKALQYKDRVEREGRAFDSYGIVFVPNPYGDGRY